MTFTYDPGSTCAVASSIFTNCQSLPKHITRAMNDSPEPAILLRGLSKQFGKFAALRRVTAEFSAGRLYCILGGNGAGKTTLLRTLAGLSRPTRGTVSLLGETDFRAARPKIGYMAHPSLLYDELSGMENLRYFACLYGIADEARCSDAIRAVALDPTLTRAVGQYSQGMRQRLSLARAFLNRPEMLLLDEPFSNVDLTSAQAMVRLLCDSRDAGKTIVVTTHQAALLDGSADEFVWMDAGAIVNRTKDWKLSAGSASELI